MTEAKPRVLYVRWPVKDTQNPIRFLQEQEITDRLSYQFDVIVHEADAEYRQLLDRYEPALTLFEHKAIPSRRPTITGVLNERSVPKAMLIRSDTFCYTRGELLREADRLDVDAYFAVDTLYPYSLEALRGKLYCEPHSIDPGQFRNFGLEKTSVISFFGHFQPWRPWRIAAAQRLHNAFACTFWPHDTPQGTGDRTRMSFGDHYIKALNASEFAPVEGGFQNLFTRKFFEVPATGCCMIVPPFPELKEYGFVDMETCIIAQPSEIVEKVDMVRRNSELYQRITTAGINLVHSKHSHASRTQIRDWLSVYNSAPVGSRVVQQGIFGPFTAEPDTGIKTSLARTSPPIDYFLLSRASRKIEKRNLEAAERDLMSCAGLLYRHFAEPNFYLAVLRLLQGRWQDALYFLLRDFVRRLAKEGATLLDPRQAALLAVCYLLAGDAEKARKVLVLHESLNHRELSFARRLSNLPRIVTTNPQASTLYFHLPFNRKHTWATFVHDAAIAHGQIELAERAKKFGAAGKKLAAANTPNRVVQKEAAQ